MVVDAALVTHGALAEQTQVTARAARATRLEHSGLEQNIGRFLGDLGIKAAHNARERHGALLAKGRMLGLQFDTLFTDDLYGRISRHAIDMAMRMKALFRKYGVKLAIDSPTNQQFVILTPEQQQRLSKSIVFEVWEQKDDRQLVCRFVTSWATSDEDLTALEKALANG